MHSSIGLQRRFAPLALCALLTSLLPAHATAQEPITLKNPGFEEGQASWEIAPAFKDQIITDTSLAHGGTQSLKIDATQAANMPYAIQNVPGLQSMATYRFSVWARVTPGSLASSAAVKMENYDAQDKNTGGHYGQATLPADGSWKEIAVTAKLEPGAVRSRLLIRVMSAGAVLFDDAAFTLLEHPAEVNILAPQHRTLQENEAREVKYDVYLARLWTSPTPPVFNAHIRSFESAAASGPIQIVRATATPGPDKQSYTVTVPLPADQHNTEVHLAYERDGVLLQSKAPAYVFTALPAARRKPGNLTDTGTLLHNGQPYFPIGMYHPSLESYPLLAQNGFNTVQGLNPGGLQRFKEILDAAAQHNLLVDVPFYGGNKVAANLEDTLAKIKAFADHPAILNWKIIDEPEYRPEVSHEVPPVYWAMKNLDSKNPIEITFSGAASLAYWKDYCDIVQLDVYPVPHSPLTAVADKAREAMAVKAPWQNLSFALQCGWTPDMKTQPTPEQARSMVYLALIEGAKGIWWYSMYDPGWDLTKTPLWPHLKTINAELTQLGQPIMLGKTVVGITSNNPKLHFRAFEHEKKTYLLVTNPQAEAVQATFTLPQRFRSWRPLNGETANPIANNQLAISFAGIDSQTYVLE